MLTTERAEEEPRVPKDRHLGKRMRASQGESEALWLRHVPVDVLTAARAI